MPYSLLATVVSQDFSILLKSTSDTHACILHSHPTQETDVSYITEIMASVELTETLSGTETVPVTSM